MASTLPRENSQFITLPSDVLAQVALESVSSASDLPSLRSINTIYSLLLTCRITHSTLSLTNNPDLYAGVWKLMFDFDSMKQWMCSSAVSSSSLASEIGPRFEALKKLRSVLRNIGQAEERFDIDRAPLIRLFMMLMENDERNLCQFLRFVDVAMLPALLRSYGSRTGSIGQAFTQNPHLSLIVALMWLTTQGTLLTEDANCRIAVLDLLEPLALGTVMRSQYSIPLYFLAHRDTTVTIRYFGLCCTFMVPSAVPFVRLCTVDRYKMLARMRKPTANLSSFRFNHDMKRYIRLATQSTTPQSTINRPTGGHELAVDAFTGHWEGSWFIAAQIKSTFAFEICCRPMQCLVRAYVSLDPKKSVRFVDEAPNNPRAALENAWLPDGIVFDENLTTLRIHDPERADWVSYIPHAEVKRMANETNTAPVIFDTILVGNTDAAHGEEYGEFSFYGRVSRTDGHIALLRKPLDPSMSYNGTWVFYGEIHGGLDFVGDWWVTSETKLIETRRGWFHLAKIQEELRL